ncbi:transcriptional repressor p66-beta [Biomphalaria glabrata]|uniref:Transcriptional repressor p66-beta-like n=1 Tax=Biomphalaria glabrata TaxID=6526 RepID=A0A9W2YDM1_BIOGL|nr:transcriptional repressor p66-beta-like [Biomphalaria glabrata]XP_013079857.2 transcriptional repressor p66-beta-like [Biomphalaria glabrata]XP_055860781.1 transcriptional repressor p66-beta-like [Biomphalaria glabrata]KAI8769204.1 transcriptional repressor p66-beta-like [Biomphalaria glabrata]
MMENERKRPTDSSNLELEGNEIKRPKYGTAESSDIDKTESENNDMASSTFDSCQPLALVKKDVVKVSGSGDLILNHSKSDSTKQDKEKFGKTFTATDSPLLDEKNKDDMSLVKEEKALNTRKATMESKDNSVTDKLSLNMSMNGSLQEGDLQKEIKSDSEDQTDETSTIKSDGSEKENMDIKKEKAESPDIIMLSDEDDETADPSTRRYRILKKVKALQNQLRNEEATLVLLKKLRQSQITQPQESNMTPTLPKPQSHHPQLSLQHMRQHSGPVSMNRANQQNSKTLHLNQSPHSNRGQAINNTTPSSRPQQGPTPMVMSRSNGQNVPSHHSHSSRGNVPNNLSRNNTNIRSQSNVPQAQQQPQSVQRQVPTPQAPPPPPPPPQDTQTPAQRQAAAKQALRKQLEKTLLQIPPPKPPPPEMNFIPSLACPDFILLLGLEEVVNHMIDFQLIARGQKNPDERFVCTPFTCVQCGSDFTPVWKREKPGSKNVICEHCVTSNQKKALKQEHTNRLKSAFVKALQQEQEIERMQASTPTPSPQPVSNTTPQPQLPSAPMISAANAAAAAATAAAAAAVANFRPSAEQLRQHHSFFQAQQVQLRAGQPLGLQAFGSRAPFPYNIPFAKQQDLQRQYLLDMIPRGSMPWKQQ